MRILVTNDDGVDSIGLHVLARAMRRHGEVVVIAPDREYSGASAALGTLHLLRPEVRRVRIDGVDEAWAVTGPPALCVMFARLGAFGAPFDLVVSGINPGANVGRSVYHSGTIGAAYTGRIGNISGVAVSQAVTGWGVEGQAWEEMLVGQKWHTAAAVADAFVEGLVADLPTEPVVVNINVPNCELDEVEGWRHTAVGTDPPRRLSSAVLEQLPGHEDAYLVRMAWGEPVVLPVDTDGGTVERNTVSITYLSRITATQRSDLEVAETSLSGLLGAP
jgi:5'-nucleotidase